MGLEMGSTAAPSPHTVLELEISKINTWKAPAKAFLSFLYWSKGSLLNLWLLKTSCLH